MQYNTQRQQLHMPEYGRCVQEMVDLAVSLPTKEQRQQCANTIVSIMSRIQPQTGSKEDLAHKLWNHLARISHYKLDIDYPVEICTEEESMEHPKPLPYPMKRIGRRHYGHLIEQSLDYAQTLPDGDMKDTLVKMIANQMKQDLFMWNRDSMDENLVAQDIARYSKGSLRLDLGNFKFASVGVPNLHQISGTGKKKKKR